MKNTPSHHLSLPYISIQPNRLTTYYQTEGKRAQTFKDISETIKPKNNDPRRGLSKKARKRITSKINWLLTFSKSKRIFNDATNNYFNFRINFITLTLPAIQAHKDNTIKKVCLNQFITELRQSFELRNYVWRAEAQRNGSIHFHFVTDTYIPWFVIRRIWNRQVEKLGYVTRFQDKFKSMDLEDYTKWCNGQGTTDISTILTRYKRGIKTNWRDPNTTDIHSVNKVRNLAAYLSKYMSKGETAQDEKGEYELKARRIQGKIWGCSQSLSACKSIIDLVDSTYTDILNECVELKNAFVLKENYFTFISADFKTLSQSTKQLINSIFLTYKKSIEYISGGIPNKIYRYANI